MYGTVSKSKQLQSLRLINIQKNIVMRRVAEIKQNKEKPGLKQAIELTIKKK